MAENRTKDIIYVFSQELICKNCKDWYEHIDPLDKTDCDNCEDIADLPHISRQQAIERINHAICIEVHGDCDKCDKKKYNLGYPCDDFKRYAEAALNTLLGEK